MNQNKVTIVYPETEIISELTPGMIMCWNSVATREFKDKNPCIISAKKELVSLLDGTVWSWEKIEQYYGTILEVVPDGTYITLRSNQGE
jgi:hypothetical protein